MRTSRPATATSPRLEDVSLAIEAGSLLAVVGPNGAGKSTLLKVMAGLLAPWSGRVEILGGAPGREAHRVAYVPQAETVDWSFPVTVGDVVMMGRYPLLGPLRRPGPDDRRHVAEALEKVGMTSHRQTQIGRLSGGQRRRVFLARALAADPALYLLDEPVTGIDATTQEDLMDILDAEAQRGRTVVATYSRPGLRRGTVSAGRGDQSPPHRRWSGFNDPRTRTSCRAPTAVTSWSLGGQPVDHRRRASPRPAQRARGALPRGRTAPLMDT